MKLPGLTIEDSTVEEILARMNTSGMLLITDSFNFPVVGKFGNPTLVKNINHTVDYEEPATSDIQGVVAIGGCSALDVGRIVARCDTLILIPTILSTSCLSVNISIIRSRKRKIAIPTVTPLKTIIPLRTVMQGSAEDLVRFSASGVGDLLANISAAIHYEVRNGSSSYDNIRSNAAIAFEALEWIESSFSGFDENALRALACYLHESSLQVIRQGTTELSADFEHTFYERIIGQQRYSSHRQTHGFLVAIGTLVTSAIFERIHGSRALTERLRSAYDRIGIPRSFRAMEINGICRGHVARAFLSLKDTDNFVSRFISERGFDEIDRLFEGEQET